MVRAQENYLTIRKEILLIYYLWIMRIITKVVKHAEYTLKMVTVSIIANFNPRIIDCGWPAKFMEGIS